MAKTAIEPQRGLTFEDVWAAFARTDERMDASSKRVDERIAQMTARMEASSKRVDEHIDRLTKRMEASDKRWGDLSHSIGDLVEVLVAARLWEKFDGYPYNLKRAHMNVQIFDDNYEQIGEIDILLSNTNWVMPVEVKHKLKVSDVEHHRKRMKLIQKYPPAEAKGKKMVGAVAGGFVSKEARDAAFAAGLFVVELTGENAALIPPPAGFKPAEW